MDSADEDWTVEKITYTAAYGNEQASAYLLLPKTFKPPLCRPCCTFPATVRSSFPLFPCLPPRPWMQFSAADRAVLYPVYKGTYERADGTKGSGPYRSVSN